MSDHMREQFEDMMSSQGEWPQAIEKDPRGSYKFATAATAWETWQSAWEAGQEMMKSRIKELEAENAELRKRGAVFYALQKDEGSVLMNLHTEQLEIYDTLRAARSAAKTGYRVVSIRICQNDEEGAA